MRMVFVWKFHIFHHISVSVPWCALRFISVLTCFNCKSKWNLIAQLTIRIIYIYMHQAGKKLHFPFSLVQSEIQVFTWMSLASFLFYFSFMNKTYATRVYFIIIRPKTEVYNSKKFVSTITLCWFHSCISATRQRIWRNEKKKYESEYNTTTNLLENEKSTKLKLMLNIICIFTNLIHKIWIFFAHLTCHY